LAEAFLLPNDSLAVIAFFLCSVYDLNRLPVRDMTLGSTAEHTIQKAAHSTQSVSARLTKIKASRGNSGFNVCGDAV
jgi:hypothetical protein